MAKGMSLHIGLNSVDPNHYGGWSGDLVACENDATDMGQIASAKGFSSKALLTAAATRETVKNEIRLIASDLVAGDIFFLSYSGHGGQLRDLNMDELDGKDETWCLFDGELVDDELFDLWNDFEHGVRIVVLSDSCHSGTMLKARILQQPTIGGRRPKCLPPMVAVGTYQDNRTFYDEILSKQYRDQSTIRASVRLISGCQDNQANRISIASLILMFPFQIRQMENCPNVRLMSSGLL